MFKGREINTCNQRIQDCNRDIAEISDKKHKIKVDIANVKNKLAMEMQEFARELEVTKQSIGNSQELILGSIREKLYSTFDNAKNYTMNDTVNGISTSYGNRSLSASKKMNSPPKIGRSYKQRNQSSMNDIQNLLRETNTETITDLIHILQQSEENCFEMYKNIQLLNEELDKLDLENRQIEYEVDKQNSKLELIELHNTKIRTELESQISVIQKSIAKYETEYNSHLEVLRSVSEGLLLLLRNVSKLFLV